MFSRVPAAAKRGIFLILTACLPLAATAAPEPPVGAISPSEYTARRQALAEALRAQLAPGEMGILLIRSLPEQH